MRYDYLDNAKLVLMLMVVFGHLLEPIKSHSQIVTTLHSIIYVFHMPAFVFLAGITSKPSISVTRLCGFLLILALFQTLYVSLYAKHDFPYWSQPYWILWFILSLLCWNLILPVFHRIPYPVIIAIILALANGLVPSVGYPFSLSRTLVFLPFFMLGHFHGKALLAWFAANRSPSRAVIIAITGLLTIGTLGYYVQNIGWLYGSYSYQQLNVTDLYGILFRVMHLMAATSGIAMLLVIVPKQRCFFTSNGSKILSVFLLHGLFIIPMRSIFSALAEQSLLFALLLSAASSLVLIWLLSLNAFYSPLYSIYRLKPFGNKLSSRKLEKSKPANCRNAPE